MAAVTSCETALSQTEGQLGSSQQTEGQEGHHLFKVDSINKKNPKGNMIQINTLIRLFTAVLRLVLPSKP